MRTKRPFTLFEILIVMVLIASALGVLSLQISKAVRGERSERGVEQVIAKLSLAQEIMLDFQTGVRLTLDQRGNEIECSIDTDLALPPFLANSINRYSKIKGIDQIMLDHIVRDRIILSFDETLGTTPQATLTFVSDGKERSIDLKGYPAQIKRKTYDQIYESQAIYPEEVISAI